MKFNTNPKETSTKTNNNSNMPNFQLPPASLNTNIPKNNLGTPEKDSHPRSNSSIGYNPDDGTFSPIPKDFRYAVKLPLRYPESSLDWGEPSFGFGMEFWEENTPQSNTSPAQITATLNSETADQLHSSGPMIHKEINENKLIGNHQSDDKKSTPTLNVDLKQYKYESLEEAFMDWINSLNVKITTKKHYRLILINFIRILDSKGIYHYDEVEISDYCNCRMKNYDYRTIRDSKSAAKRFFNWVKRLRIYNKIRPHDSIDENLLKNNTQQQPQSEAQVSAQLISKSLSKIFNEWSKSLQNDSNTNASYKAQILDFILFLTAIKTLQPTKQNIINFFKGKLKLRGYKQIIKSFLQFMEQMGIPQDPEVYDFLDSDIEIK